MLEYNICYSLDSKYAEQLAVSMVSILKNADIKENINFYILDGGLTEQDKFNIELLKNIKDFSINYITINSDDFKSCPMLKDLNENYSSYHVTLPTYFRFKLPSLLKSLDKVLYLDCDVIIRSSLKDLFSKNLKNSAVIMVLDAETKRESQRLNIKNYFNAGVMLINLDYWRKNNVEQKLFDYAQNNKDKILWQDQDVINVVLKDEIKNLDNKWNYQYFLYEEIDVNKLAESAVLHLSGRFKPWLMPFEHPVYDCYYSYLSFTNWKNKIIEYKQLASNKHLKNNIGGSETNILISATDEDVRKLYQELDNNYKYVKTESEKVLNQARENISEIYEEIEKNYEFTKELSQKITEEITVQTDEKIAKTYEEITKSYEFTKELSEKNKDEISRDADEKIGRVYDEISKNYEYTTDLVESKQEEITKSFTGLVERVETQAIEKFEETKSILSSSINNVHSQTDEKIGKVYEQITKNYDYTADLNQKTKDELYSNINTTQNNITNETDCKIGKVYDEVSKNYKYTEELVENLQVKVQGNIDSINNNLNIANDNINRSFEKTDNLKNYTDNKLNDLYAFLNESIAGIYTDISEHQNLIDDKVNGFNYQSAKRAEEHSNKIKQSLIALEQEVERQVNAFDTKNKEQLDKLQNIFSEELNNQRIKYEKKLIEMENIINSLDEKYQKKKKSIFSRIVNKFKRVK